MTRAGIKQGTADASHTTLLLAGLNALRKQGHLLDVTLRAGQETFQGHRVVLASCSDYFRAMFTGEMREKSETDIRLHGVSASGLSCLLEYAYTSRLVLTEDNVSDVLATAAHLQVASVVHLCSDFLQLQLDLENCVDIVTIADTYSLDELRRKVCAFMCLNFQSFTKTAAFQRMTSGQLVRLLSLDYPVDCSETKVLEMLTIWLLHDWTQRYVHTAALLSVVNLSHISRKSIETITRSVPFEIEIPPCHKRSATPRDLVNVRGVALGMLKIGGFSVSGVTNEITCQIPAVGRWRHLTAIPHVPQCNYGAAVYRNHLYIVGGCYSQAQSLDEIVHAFGFRYDPARNHWTTMARMRTERCRFTLSVVGGKLLAVGGASEIEDHTIDSCEAYDPVEDLWRPIHSLPRGRAQHAACAVNDTLLVTGGFTSNRVLDSCLCYNPGRNLWRETPPMLTPRADHSSISYREQVYVCGGWCESANANGRTPVATIDCFDPVENTWSVVTTVPTPRFHSSIVIVDDCLYVIGGFTSDDLFDRISNIIECFHFVTGQWETKNEYPTSLWEHTCAALYVPSCREDVDVA